mmetsp:Transcript_19873/g.43479  ORF Transcript_19873/g.43479 Transcript_19873/m.43479 type:complete len:254 (-) Transcript_19873:683-1444(-)
MVVLEVAATLRGRLVPGRHLRVTSGAGGHMNGRLGLHVGVLERVVRQRQIVDRKVSLVVVDVTVNGQVDTVLVQQILHGERAQRVGGHGAVVSVGWVEAGGRDAPAGGLVLRVARALRGRVGAVHWPMPGDDDPGAEGAVVREGGLLQVRHQPVPLPLHVRVVEALREEEHLRVVAHHVRVAHVVAVEEVLGLLVVGHGEVVEVVREVVVRLVVARGDHVREVRGHALELPHEVHPNLPVGGPEVVRQVSAVE